MSEQQSAALTSRALVETGDIALLISDVDGTLVTPEKVLTPAAAAAVRRLRAAGVAFTIISARPPRGLAALLATLDIRLPFGAFNGGSLVAPDLSPIETHRLDVDVARQTLRLLAERRIEAWVFADGDWRLRDPNGSNVPLERRTIGFDPTVVGGFDDVIERIDKIVGVSDDYRLLAHVETEAQTLIGERAAIMLSQPRYLDVTHPKANKGDGVSALCARMGVDLSQTAVIGDMFNDVAMFARAGVSIAMGQAPDAVKARAQAVTLSNTEDGFASAVDRFILPRAAGVASIAKTTGERGTLSR
jgi:Cof subfamily protein (haloacid dehalogenase superfamily)